MPAEGSTRLAAAEAKVTELMALLATATAEFLQQWAPGRLPDTTDIAALLIGAALVQAAPLPRLHT